MQVYTKILLGMVIDVLLGAAGVPGAGMITLMMVLTTAGIPPSGLALTLGVDRLLDMFRSAVNVTGDLAVAAVLDTREAVHVKLDAQDIRIAAVARAGNEYPQRRAEE